MPTAVETHKIIPFLRYSHPPIGLKAYLNDKGIPANEISNARSVLKELFDICR